MDVKKKRSVEVQNLYMNVLSNLVILSTITNYFQLPKVVIYRSLVIVMKLVYL